MIEQSKTASGLKSEIQNHLQIIFGDRFDGIPFAVRSSAIGKLHMNYSKIIKIQVF